MQIFQEKVDIVNEGGTLAVSTCARVPAGGGRGRIGAHACRGGPRTRHSTLAGQASRAALRRRPPQHSHRQVTHLSCPLLIINCLHHYHAITLFPRCCNVCLPRQIMFSWCLVVSQLQCATAANLKGPGLGRG